MDISLKTIRKKTEQLVIEHAQSLHQVRLEKEELVLARKDVTAAAHAQDIAQRIAQAVQQEAHNRISRVVTRCLQTVFEEPYEFRIVFERKRGRTEARLVFVREEKEIDPLTASGGGVVDVAAFALRLSCLCLSRPYVRKLVVLDEPFRFLSVQYRPRVVLMMQTLAKEMKVQFITVTHSEELEIGKVIEVG